MPEELNLKMLRNGKATDSSPTNNTNNKQQQANKGSGNPPNKNEEAGKSSQGEIIPTGSAQDIWGLITTMHTTLMRQSEQISELALKNQELEHKLQMQDIKHEQQISKLQELLEKEKSKIQEAMYTQTQEQHVQNVDDCGSTWANVVQNGNTAANIMHRQYEKLDNEENAEYKEMEKRKMNIVIRGIPEKEEESVLALQVEISNIISEKFGMQDIVVYGTHRLGKKKPDMNRAVICTMLDARKREIILENARIYLQDSQLYISEDRTPNQQKARRKAYEERINKKTKDTPKDT